MFCKMGVNECESRAEAEKDETGKFVKVKWVRTKKGTESGVVWSRRSWSTANGQTSCSQEHHRLGQCAWPSHMP